MAYNNTGVNGPPLFKTNVMKCKHTYSIEQSIANPKYFFIVSDLIGIISSHKSKKGAELALKDIKDCKQL